MQNLFLCHCSNCGEILQDTNPQENAIQYPIDPLKVKILSNFVEDGECCSNGCPNCKTDGFLSDEIPEELFKTILQ